MPLPDQIENSFRVQQPTVDQRSSGEEGRRSRMANGPSRLRAIPRQDGGRSRQDHYNNRVRARMEKLNSRQRKYLAGEEVREDIDHAESQHHGRQNVPNSGDHQIAQNLYTPVSELHAGQVVYMQAASSHGRGPVPSVSNRENMYQQSHPQNRSQHQRHPQSVQGTSFHQPSPRGWYTPVPNQGVGTHWPTPQGHIHPLPSPNIPPHEHQFYQLDYIQSHPQHYKVVCIICGVQLLMSGGFHPAGYSSRFNHTTAPPVYPPSSSLYHPPVLHALHDLSYGQPVHNNLGSFYRPVPEQRYSTAFAMIGAQGVRELTPKQEFEEAKREDKDGKFCNLKWDDQQGCVYDASLGPLKVTWEDHELKLGSD